MEVPAVVKQQEEFAHRAARLHFAAYHVEQDRKREEQLKADRERAQQEHLEFLVRNKIFVAKPKPKPSLLARIFGR